MKYIALKSKKSTLYGANDWEKA